MASRGQRPGLFDSFRVGWAPAKRVGGSSRRARAAAPTGAGRPPAGGAGRGRSAGKGAAARKPAGAGPNGASSAGRSASPKLTKRQEELARRYAQLQWDLGGIAYEMARRDHYRLEVLNAHAAKLQEVDAELGQIERLVKLDEAGAAGACPSCGALQARGAHYCWRCGKQVTPGAEVPAASEGTEAAPAKGEAAPAVPGSKPPPPAKTIAKSGTKKRSGSPRAGSRSRTRSKSSRAKRA